ncbi:MAG: ankyrin repeat domain-containing protein [Salinisphaera sp.]|jgi:hypothetical protein|nr:ankyrin repeat domain-containing protein [Salinisphaera sp.]
MKKTPLSVFLVFGGLTLVVAVAAGLYEYSQKPERAPAQPTGQGKPPQAAPSESSQQPEAPPPAEQPSKESSGQHNTPASPTNEQARQKSPAEQFCGRDFSDVSSRTSDAAALAKAGGLVQIFQHEAALSDPYGCADFYLKHGLNIDAADPRSDSQHLTPLLFAIKRNDPKMVTFMLDHGADLKQRGGPEKIKPYGYAVYLALHNRSTNYNPVIGLLDQALTKQSAKASANQ